MSELFWNSDQNGLNIYIYIPVQQLVIHLDDLIQATKKYSNSNVLPVQLPRVQVTTLADHLSFKNMRSNAAVNKEVRVFVANTSNELDLTHGFKLRIKSI